jgi:hypothetical protein
MSRPTPASWLSSKSVVTSGTARNTLLDRKEHVAHTEILEGWVQPGWIQPGFADEDDLIVHLNPREAALFGVPSLTVLELAAMVMQFWTEDLESRRPPSE